MNIKDFNMIPKYAGIYYFKNKINNKYYIGQSFTLRKRMKKHIQLFNNNKYDAPIYKAFKKYGLDNFEYGVLDSFRVGFTKDELIEKLDTLEIYYIKKYKSYGKGGYNQTKGGDAGITGYKFTEDQRSKVSKANKKSQSDGRHLIYIYDVLEKCYYTFVNNRYAQEYFNLNSKFVHTTNIKLNRYISARSKKELDIKIKEYFKTGSLKTGKYATKLKPCMITDILQNISCKDFLNKYDVCKKTFYNYRDKLLK